MIRSGRVTKAEKGMIRVCFEKAGSCEGCSGCGNGRSFSECEMPAQEDVREGDSVLVDFSEKKLLCASFLVYIIPLTVFLSGILLGELVFQNDALAVAAALIGLAVSFFVLRVSDRKRKAIPVIISVQRRSSAEAAPERETP